MKSMTTKILALTAALFGLGITTPAMAAVQSGTKVISYSSIPGATQNDSAIYDYVYGVFKEGGTLDLSFTINYDGKNCGAFQCIFHAGAKDTGFSIYENGGPHLIFGQKNNHNEENEVYHDIAKGSHTIVCRFANNGTDSASVCVFIDGTRYDCKSKKTWSWSDMAWSSTAAECNKYSMGCQAPGWGSAETLQTTTIADNKITATYTSAERSKMYSNRLSGGEAVVTPGEYGAITVPGAGYKATAYTSRTTLSNTASGDEITGAYTDIIKKPSADTDTATHTFAGWFMIGSLPASGSTTFLYHARSQGTGANDNGYMVAVTSGGEIKVGKTDKTSFKDGLVSTGASIEGGKWFHLAVAVTKSASARTATPVVYVNGNKVTMASGTFATNLGGNNCLGVDIGAGVSAAGIYVDQKAIASDRVIEAATGFVVQASFVGTVTTSADWANLSWSPSVPTAGADVKLINNGADGVTTVTLGSAITVGKLTVESAAGKELKFANYSNLTATSLDFTQAPGGVGIDATSGWTVTDTLRRYVRDNNVKVKFYGSGNNGATLTYALDLNKSIQGHLIFEGGKHALTYGNSVQNAPVFGVNGSLENPTILVKNGTMLDFTGKDLCGWTGAADMNGVIKVEDGGRINMKSNSGDHVYYRQRIALNPGAQFYVDMAADCFRLQGGVVDGSEQLYVPAGSGTAYVKPTDSSRDSIYLDHESTIGMGVFVGAGSTLDIQTKIACEESDTYKNNFEIAKRGTGTLKLSGDISGYWNNGYDGYVVKFSVYTGDLELAMAQAVKCQIWFGGNSNLRLTGDGTDLSGYLDGTGKVVCNSAGTVTISRADNNYSGGTVIQSGTLKIGTATSLGSGAITFAGGTLDLNGQTLTGKTISGSGTIVNSSNTAASINGVSVAAGKSYTIAEGKLSITVPANETLTLTALPPANTVKIGGSGRVTYSNTTMLAPNAGMWADDWTGTFAYSGVSGANVSAITSTGWDLTPYYNGTKSTFEFSGSITSGYFYNGSFSVGELVITKGSSIKFTDGHTGEINHYCFTRFSGEGTFEIATSSSASPCIKITDTSAFSGTVKNTSTNDKGGGYRIIMGTGDLRAEGNVPTKAAIHFTGAAVLRSVQFYATRGSIAHEGSVVTVADNALPNFYTGALTFANGSELAFATKNGTVTANAGVTVESNVTVPVTIVDTTEFTAKALVIWNSNPQPAGNFDLLTGSGAVKGTSGFKASKNDTNLTAVADDTKTYYEVEGGETTTTFDNQWLTAAGVTGSTTEEVQEKLDTPNANGIKPSDAYLMGYEAKDAQNAAVILKPDQAQSNGESISLSVAGVPNETRNGAVVTYTAQSSADRNWENPTEKAMDTLSVDMALPTSGVLYYRVQATVALP